MAIAFTNKRKALNLLKEGGFDTAEIEKGSAKKFTLDAGKLKKIVEGDKDNVFEILNSAGKLLKDSILTRSTGHKEYDFSSVQSASALALEKFYINLENSIDDALNNDESLSDEQKKIVKEKLTKIWVILSGSLKVIGASEELKKIVNDALAVKSQSEITANFKKILDDAKLGERLDGFPTPSVEETEAAKRGVDQDTARYYAKAGGNWLSASIVAGGIGLIALKTGTPLIAVACACGGAMGLVTALALGLVITGLVINANKESFAKIKIKKNVIKIQGIFTKVLGQINELNRTVKQMRKENLKGKLKDEAEVPAETKQKIRDFVEAQKKLWAKYSTAAARNYDHEKDDSNKHKSAGKLVSDEKTSRIGKAKQGLANQWLNLEVIK